MESTVEQMCNKDAIRAEYEALRASPVPNMGAALAKLEALKRLEALLAQA